MSNIVDQIERHILSGCTYAAERAIGVEIETIIYNNNGERIPVNPGTEYSAADFIQAIDLGCKDMGTFVTCSLEPGGQVEWASLPAPNIHDIQNELSNLQKLIDNICIENDLTIVD